MKAKITKFASNMRELDTGNKVILISYATPVAIWVPNKKTGESVMFVTNKYYSRTTKQHIAKWRQSTTFHQAAEVKEVAQVMIDSAYHQALKKLT